MTEEKNIPVIKKEDNSVHWINIQDVCFSAVVNNQIVYHTRDEVYYHIKSFDELITTLSKEEFERTDRSSMVQMDQVTFYDSEYGKLFFDPVITKDSKYATVSRTYMSKVKAKLGPDKDIAKRRSNQA